MYANSKSTLPAETDALIERVIGCALAVHRAIGPGFLESIHARALEIELRHHGIPFEREKPIVVAYRGIDITGQRVDFVVDAAVIVEVKAVTRVEPIFEAKLLSYLRTMRLRAGLLINFHERLLRNGIKRVVL